MNTPLIDSHAHLDFDRFDADRDQVLQRATACGVDTVITIGTTIASSQRARDLAEQYDMLYATAGIHPHQVDDFLDSDWHMLEALWDRERVIGVGETGLDYFYDYADRGRQQAVFERHLEAARIIDYPVIIHIRDAFDDAFRLVESVGAENRGIVHCFTGGAAECERALSLGMYISLSGIVTFKNAKALREAVPMIPDDRLLVETDSPFLAPVPHRGQRNEPVFVLDTAREVARLRNTDFEHIAKLTRANTQTVFRMHQ